MQVAILYDIDGWAYHAEAKGLQKYIQLNNIKADLYKVGTFNSLPKDGELVAIDVDPISFSAEQIKTGRIKNRRHK